MNRSITAFQSGSAGFTIVLCSLLIGFAPEKSEAHQSFETPEAAVAGFIAALEQDNVAELGNLLGPGSEEILDSGDPVKDKNDRAAFLEAYQTRNSLSGEGDTRTLIIGGDDWPFPVPVVKRDGRWYLDGNEGAYELVYRRIGNNELGAIAVCRGIVEAQLEYASTGHDGDPEGIFAMKLISDDGMQNGLYWPTTDDEPPSPAGPFVAAAAEEGYRRSTEARVPYHGYHYRLLYRQGDKAEGGAREYFANGVLTQGFAVIAWPADYEVSGVMTFIVNQDGVVYQQDLGEDTESSANAINEFNPDSGWVAVNTET
jgi:hypothetical protein